MAATKKDLVKRDRQLQQNFSTTLNELDEKIGQMKEGFLSFGLLFANLLTNNQQDDTNGNIDALTQSEEDFDYYGKEDYGSTSCGNCVFPFTFGGRKHTTCTTIDGDSPWCATEVDSSGALVEGKYEYCTDSFCPGHNPLAINVNTINAVGSCCE